MRRRAVLRVGPAGRFFANSAVGLRARFLVGLRDFLNSGTIAPLGLLCWPAVREFRGFRSLDISRCSGVRTACPFWLAQRFPFSRNSRFLRISRLSRFSYFRNSEAVAPSGWLCGSAFLRISLLPHIAGRSLPARYSKSRCDFFCMSVPLFANFADFANFAAFANFAISRFPERLFLLVGPAALILANFADVANFAIFGMPRRIGRLSRLATRRRSSRISWISRFSGSRIDGSSRIATRLRFA